MFSIKNLKIIRSSGKRCKTILESGNFSMAPSGLLDIDGRSGEGKTSILLAIARLIPIVNGEICLEGKKHKDIKPEIWRTKVSLVPQKPLMIQGSVKENLLLFWSFSTKKEIPLPNENSLREELKSVGLENVSLKIEALKLSVGQTARIALLRVLIYRPRVLLLDEISANLDSFSIELVDKKLVNFLKEGNYIIRVQHHSKGIKGNSKLTLSNGNLL